MTPPLYFLPAFSIAPFAPPVLPAAVRLDYMKSLRERLQQDLPRRCGDGDDSYLNGVEAALQHTIDTLNQDIGAALWEAFNP